VVVVGGRVLGRALPFVAVAVAATTYCRAAVVREEMIIRTRSLGLTLDLGRM